MSSGVRAKSGLAIFWLVLWLFLPLFTYGESFRFAFLSDTHVGSTTGEEDLRATVRDINAQTNLSFAVLSGDVTEYGSLEQLRLAREILSELKIPYHVVPGNHDTKWSESGATDFPKLWGDERFVFEHGGFRFIGMHEGPLMKMADGYWAPQDIRWLEETLRNLPDKNQPLILVTHYPLDNGIANWFVVLDMLKKFNLQAVLCGHVHRNGTNSFEGVPGISGRSNLRAGAKVGGYNIVEIKDGRMTFSERNPGQETKAPWHTVTLKKHDFAADKTQYPRPDFSINERYPKVQKRWQFDSKFTIASTPAIWRDNAIVGNAEGRVFSIALRSGRVMWEFKTGGPVYSTPDAANELVVFASTDGSVYALKAADGKQAWRYETSRPIVASPRIADGTVFLGSSEGKFRALNLSDGKLLWQFEGVQGFVETRPLVYDGKVIFGAWDGHLYALNAKTGALVWKWKGDKPGALLSPAACWPVAANGKIFIVAPDRKMTAIDAKTGEQIWRTSDYMVRESIGISPDGRQFYVRAMQDFIYAFRTTPAQPEKIWEINGGFGYDINSGMLMEKDGVVFYGTKNGVVIALNAATGEIKWQHKLSYGVVNTVVPLNANAVLTTDFDGKVTLISYQP